jgi:hypothetical protein
VRSRELPNQALDSCPEYNMQRDHHITRSDLPLKSI